MWIYMLKFFRSGQLAGKEVKRYSNNGWLYDFPEHTEFKSFKTKRGKYAIKFKI